MYNQPSYQPYNYMSVNSCNHPCHGSNYAGMCNFGSPITSMVFPNQQVYTDPGMGQNEYTYVNQDPMCMPMQPTSPVHVPPELNCRDRKALSDEQCKRGTLNVRYRNGDTDCCEKEVNIKCVTDTENIKNVSKKITEMLGNLSACFPSESNLRRPCAPPPTDPGCPRPYLCAPCSDMSCARGEGPAGCKSVASCQRCKSAVSCHSEVAEDSGPCLCQQRANTSRNIILTVAVMLVIGAVSCYLNLF